MIVQDSGWRDFGVDLCTAEIIPATVSSETPPPSADNRERTIKRDKEALWVSYGTDDVSSVFISDEL